jgi:glycogen(starch) synthase
VGASAGDGDTDVVTRILVVTNMYPPHHYGGYELSCRDVVERWRARGHTVDVLTSRLRLTGVDDVDEPGVRRELHLYWNDHVLMNPSPLGRLRIERHNQRVFTAALEHSRPEVVSAWNMGAMSFALLTSVIERRLPLVCVVCGDWLVHGPEMDAWTRAFARRPTLGRVTRRLTGLPTTVADLGEAATFCFISDALRAEARSESPWHLVRTTVTYSGIAPEDFTFLPAAPDAAWRWRLLYAGRIDARKGIETAIRALGQLPAEAILEINGRGDGGEQARLGVVAADLGVGDRIEWRDERREELAARYHAADVLLFPTTWEEPFGLVPLEAMACGTPVISTATGGTGEYLVDGVNGLVVPKGDHRALAAAVERLAADVALRARLVEAGRITAEGLHVDGLADVLEGWHIAAARGFDEGTPADRAPIAPVAT